MLRRRLWQTENTRGGSPMKTVKLFVLAAFPGACRRHGQLRRSDIYPDPGQARADLAAALKTAAATHRRVLLDFGGNWCGDCQVLDLYYARRATSRFSTRISSWSTSISDTWMPISTSPRSTAFPLHKGVPALAVLSERGALLYSQKNGEFEAMRSMESSSVTEFLVKWRPARTGCSVWW
jgi:thioredoxin 1